MKAFFEQLKELKEYEKINKELEKGAGIIQITGLIDASKAHLFSGFTTIRPM